MAACESDSEDSTETVLVSRGGRHQQSTDVTSPGCATVQDRKAKVTGWLKNSNADENENLLPPPQGVRQRQRPSAQSRSLQKTARRQPTAAARAGQHPQSRAGPHHQKGDAKVPNDDAERASETAKRLQGLEAPVKEQGREEVGSKKRKDVGKDQTCGGDINRPKVAGVRACSSAGDSKHSKSGERSKETKRVKVKRGPDKEGAKNMKHGKPRTSRSSPSTGEVKRSEMRESHCGVSLDSSDCTSVCSVRSGSSGTSHSHRGKQKCEGSDASSSDTHRTSSSLKSKGATAKSSSISSSCSRDATSSSSSKISSSASSVKTSERSRCKPESENSQKHFGRADSAHSSSLPFPIEEKPAGRQNSLHATSCTEESKVYKTTKTNRLHPTRTDASGYDKAKVQGAQKNTRVELPVGKKGKENKLGTGLDELFAPDVQIQADPDRKHNAKKHSASKGQGVKSTCVVKERETRERPRMRVRETVQDSQVQESPRKRSQNAAVSQKREQPSSGGDGKTKEPRELNPSAPRAVSLGHASSGEEVERGSSLATSQARGQNKPSESVSAAVTTPVHSHVDAVPDSTRLAQPDAKRVQGDELEDLSELSDDSEGADFGAFEAMFPELAQDGNLIENETEGKDASLAEEGNSVQDEIEVENMLDDIAQGIENGEYSDLKTSDRRGSPVYATEVGSAQDSLIQQDETIDTLKPDSKAAAVPEENVKIGAEPACIEISEAGVAPEVSPQADPLAPGGEMTRPREGNTPFAEAVQHALPHRIQPVVEGTPVVTHSEMTSSQQNESVLNPTQIDGARKVSSVTPETVPPSGNLDPLVKPVSNNIEAPIGNGQQPTMIAPKVTPNFSFSHSEPGADSRVERRHSSADTAGTGRSLSSEGLPGCTYSPISSDEEGEIVSGHESEPAGEEAAARGDVELALAYSPVSSIDGEPGCSPITSDDDDRLASPGRCGLAAEREDEYKMRPAPVAESANDSSVEQMRDESREESRKQEEVSDTASNVEGLAENVSLQKNEVRQDNEIDEEKPDLKSEEYCAWPLEKNGEHQKVKERGSPIPPVSETVCKTEPQCEENTQEPTACFLFDAMLQHKKSPAGSDEDLTADDTHELSAARLSTADIRLGSPQDAVSAETQHQTATDSPNQEQSRSSVGVDPELGEAFAEESNEAGSDTGSADRADGEVADAVDETSGCEADLDGGLILTEGFDEIQRLLRELSDAVPSVPEFGTARSILDSIREVVDLQESNRSPHVQPFLASCALAVRGILCTAYTVVGAADEEELQTRRHSQHTEAESYVPDTDANEASVVAEADDQAAEVVLKVEPEDINAVDANMSEMNDQNSFPMQASDALEAIAGSKEASDASSRDDSKQTMSEHHLPADLITEETASSKSDFKIKEEPGFSDLQTTNLSSQFSSNGDEDQTGIDDNKADVKPVVPASEEALSSSTVYAEGNDSGFSSVDNTTDGDAAKSVLCHWPGGVNLAVVSPIASEAGVCAGAAAARAGGGDDAGMSRAGNSVECVTSEHTAPDPPEGPPDPSNVQSENPPRLGVPEHEGVTPVEKQPSVATRVQAAREVVQEKKRCFTPKKEDVTGPVSLVETAQCYQGPGSAKKKNKKQIAGSENKRQRRSILLEGIFGKEYMFGKSKEKIGLMWSAFLLRIRRNISVGFSNEGEARKHHKLFTKWVSSNQPLYNGDLINFRLLSGFGNFGKIQARIDPIEFLPLNPFGIDFHLLTGRSFMSKKARKRANNQAQEERQRAENEQTGTEIGPEAGRNEDGGVTSGTGVGRTAASCGGAANDGRKPAVGGSSLQDKTSESGSTSETDGAPAAGDGNLQHSIVDTSVSEAGAETDAAAPKTASMATAMLNEDPTCGNMAAPEEVVEAEAAVTDGRVLSAGDLALKMAAESGEYDLEEGEIVSESSDEPSAEISSVESRSRKCRRRRSGSPRRRDYSGKRSNSPAGDKRKRRRSSSRHSVKRRRRRAVRSPRSRSRSADRRPRSRSPPGTAHKRRGLPAGEGSDSMDEWETISSVGYAESSSLSDISPAKSTLVEVPIIDMGPILKANPGAIVRTKCKADNEAFVSGNRAGSKGKENTVRNGSEPFPMPNSHRDEKKDTSSEDEMDSEVIPPTKTEADEATEEETKKDQGSREDEEAEVETKKEIASSDSTASASVPGVSASDKLQNRKKKHSINVMAMKQRFAEFKRRCGMTAPAMAEALSDALELPEDKPNAKLATKQKNTKTKPNSMRSTKGPKAKKPGGPGGPECATGDILLNSSVSAGEGNVNQSCSEAGMISGTTGATDESRVVDAALNGTNAAAVHPASSSQACGPVECPEKETRQGAHEKESHDLSSTLASTSSSVGQTNNEDTTATCDTFGERLGAEPTTPSITSAGEVGEAHLETGELAKSAAKEECKLVGYASLSDKAAQSVSDGSVDSKTAAATPPKFQSAPPKMCEIPFIGTVEAGSHLFQTCDVRESPGAEEATVAPQPPAPQQEDSPPGGSAAQSSNDAAAADPPGAAVASAGEDAGAPQEAAGADRCSSVGSQSSETEVDQVRVLEDEPDAEDGGTPQPTGPAVPSYKRPAADWEWPPPKRTRGCPPRPARGPSARQEAAAAGSASESGPGTGGARSPPASAGERAPSPAAAAPHPLPETAGDLGRSRPRSGCDTAHPRGGGLSRRPSSDSTDRRPASTPTNVNTPHHVASVVTILPTPASGHVVTVAPTPASGHVVTVPPTPVSGHVVTVPPTPASGHVVTVAPTPVCGHVVTMAPTPVSGHVASVVTVPPNIVCERVVSTVTVSSQAGAAVHPPETPEPVYSTNCARPPRAGRSAESGRAENQSRSRSGERSRVAADRRPKDADSPKCPDCGETVKAAYGQILLQHRRLECRAFHYRGTRATSPRPQSRVARAICMYCEREVRGDLEIHSRTCRRTALRCWFCKEAIRGNLPEHLDRECTRNACFYCGARVKVPFPLHNENCTVLREREVRDRHKGSHRPRR